MTKAAMGDTTEAPMLRLRAALPMILMALAAICALWALVRGPQAQADDAYIVARYAQNLVEHGQLTWNLDEKPVEGFTGYSLLFIMTIATALHVKPLLAAVVMGIFAWFLGARLLYECHKPLGVSPFAGAFAGALFLCAAEQTTHATSGLETEIFITLTIACAFIAMKRCQDEPGSGPLWPLPILALAIALTRPEGIVVGSAFLFGVLFRERHSWKAWAPRVLLLFILPYSALQVFRRLYFGSFLPNTYYAKTLGPDHSSVFGTSFFKHASHYVLPALVVCFVVFAIARFSGKTALPHSLPVQQARRILALGIVTSFVAIGASYLRSDLVMNYSERFAYHLFGCSMLVVLVAVGEAIRHFPTITAARPIRSALFILAGVALFLPFAHALERHPGERAYRFNYSHSTEAHYQSTADWMKRAISPNATLAVYPDAGVVPYSTRLRTIDFGKLNDAYLARTRNDPNKILDYFFERKPDVLMIALTGGLERTYEKTGDLLLADPRFSAYRLTLMSTNHGTGVAVFVKR